MNRKADRKQRFDLDGRMSRYVANISWARILQMAGAVACAWCACSAPTHAIIVVNEDFEGEVGLPAGWTLVDNDSRTTGNPAFTIIQGHTGGGVFGGNGGHLGDNIDGIPNPGQPNGGWYQAPPSILATDPFTLDFDVKFEQEGTADDAAILFGDILGTARNYYTVVITETAANNDLFWLVNDDRQGTGDPGTAVQGTNGYVTTAPVNNVWYHGKLVWNPVSLGLGFTLTNPATSALLGSFNATMDGTQVDNSQVINATPTGSLQFGFGTLNDRATFDNILLSSGVLLGDTDDDGVVELSDFDPIRANFRKVVSLRSQGDLVPDGIVNFRDFGEWKTAFLGGGGSLEGVDLSFFGNVPEPTTVMMLVLAAPLVAGRRLRRSTRPNCIEEATAR